MTDQYQLQNVAQKAYHSSFISELSQTKAKLDGTTQLVMGVVGTSYRWPISGNFEMDPRTGGPNSTIPASNNTYKPIETLFQPYTKKTLSDKVFTQAEVNLNEVMNLTKDHVKAINRRKDQFVIDALANAVLPADNVIAADGTNITLKKLTQASELAADNNWDTDDMYLLVGASQLGAMLNIDKITNIDFVMQKALATGKIDNLLGFKVIVMGKNKAGGVPKDGDERRCFLWSPDAVGAAYNVAPSIKVFPLNEDLFVPITSSLAGGADVLLPEGVIEIRCDETA